MFIRMGVQRESAENLDTLTTRAIRNALKRFGIETAAKVLAFRSDSPNVMTSLRKRLIGDRFAPYVG